MNLSVVETKTALLRESLTTARLRALNAVLDREIVQLGCEAREYFFLDLVYCLLKHRVWGGVAVFRHIVCEFLSTRYNLSSASCVAVFSVAARELNLAQQEMKGLSDQEFVKYILIITLASRDNHQLLAELGFGSKFLLKLREFLQAVSRCETPRAFLDGFEAVCYESIVNLADKLVHTPAHLAIGRLQYQLLTAPPPWSTFSDSEARAVLDLLTTLAKTPLTEKTMPVLRGLPTPQLVSVFAEHGILYHGDYLPRQKVFVWHLTALGKDLVSTYRREGAELM